MSLDAPGTVPEQGRLRFVDAHHHLWDLEAHHYAWLEKEGIEEIRRWLGDYQAIRKTHAIDDYTAEWRTCPELTTLTHSVHVQAGWSGEDSVGETAWLQSIATEHGFPHGIVGEVDLIAPDVAATIERHLEYSNFRGVRMLQMGGLVTTPEFLRGYAELAKRDLTYDLNTQVPHMHEGVELAGRFPDTLVLVGNAGNPADRSSEYFELWRDGMRALASLDNVVVKVSGLGMGDHDWSIESIRPWVEEAIELFGPARCVFGTNWPVDSLYSSLRQLIHAYVSLTSSFSIEEQDMMFSSNAIKYYRLGD